MTYPQKPQKLAITPYPPKQYNQLSCHKNPKTPSSSKDKKIDSSKVRVKTRLNKNIPIT